MTSYWFRFYFALRLQFNCFATTENIEPGTTYPSSWKLFLTPKTWLSFADYYLREDKKWRYDYENCSGLCTIAAYRDRVIQILMREVIHKFFFFFFFFKQKSIWQIKKPCERERKRESLLSMCLFLYYNMPKRSRLQLLLKYWFKIALWRTKRKKMKYFFGTKHLQKAFTCKMRK